MNQLLERIDALERVSRDQQRQIDESNSVKIIQQHRIDELESRVRALEGDARKRQIEVANGSTKRIKVSGISADLSVFDGNLVVKILSYLLPADL